MQESAEKKKAKRFVSDAIKHKPDDVHVDKIVYLDEDLHTYKYFMTGQFDEDARKNEIKAQQDAIQKLERIAN